MKTATFARLILSILVGLVLVGAGATLGWRAANHKSYQTRHQYPLLDPSVSNPDVHGKTVNFDPLRQDVKNYLASLNLSHSFYFEYLPNGVNIRDGDDNISQAASLMKTPIVMDLYKLAEQGKINLENSSTVVPVDIDQDSVYGNPTHLKVGDTLTLRQAAEITLKDSDNTTLNIIKDRITPLVDDTSDSFRSLDLSYTLGGLASNQQLSISSRSYSSILKCLYYACFNNAQDATQMIQDLTGSSEPNRLAAGVGPGIKVAHKVGSGGTGAQSDCGIVYVPGKPYMICLMFFNITSGTDVDPYFQHVSKLIYDYVKAN